MQALVGDQYRRAGGCTVHPTDAVGIGARRGSPQPVPSNTAQPSTVTQVIDQVGRRYVVGVKVVDALTEEQERVIEADYVMLPAAFGGQLSVNGWAKLAHATDRTWHGL